MKKNTQLPHIQALKASYAHFFFVIAFSLYIIVYDASQLIPPQVVLRRWQYCITLFVVTTIVWFITKMKLNSLITKKLLLGLLAVTDIIIISLLIYGERGMSSVAVVMYALPIATAALTFNRSAIISASLLSIAGYAFASIKYFVDFFNEGYRVQLYTSIGFYGSVLFITGLLLVSLVSIKTQK